MTVSPSQPFPVPPSVVPPSPIDSFSTSPRHHFRMCDVLEAPELKPASAISSTNESIMTIAGTTDLNGELWWKAKGDGKGLERVLSGCQNAGSNAAASWNYSSAGNTPAVVETGERSTLDQATRSATPLAVKDVVVVVKEDGSSVLSSVSNQSKTQSQSTGQDGTGLQLRKRGPLATGLVTEDVVA